MFHRNRPKYVESMIKDVNKYLRSCGVKDEYSDTLFGFMCDYLLHRDMYRGYNFFKDFVDSDGNVFPTLACSCDKEKYDYLQIY